MKTAVKIPVKQRTPEWLAARRQLITGTDIPALLGVSPWKSEADVAADKLGESEPSDHLRMRVGSALEPLIAKEYELVTGRKVVRADGLYHHYRLQWAGASLDYRCRSYDVLVECKWTGSRTRFADGLPQDVEAQVRWQLGVTGAKRADVAVLVAGDELRIFPVQHDQATWDGLVSIASDFRERLAAGGPFSHNAESVKRAHPADDGTELDAPADVAEAVDRLISLRAQRIGLEKAEEQIETAIKARMGDAAVLRGPSWRVVWKRTKDRTETDWKAAAGAALGQLAEPERIRLMAEHSRTVPGFRPFKVAFARGEED